MAIEASNRNKVYTLGPIIHNPQVVEKLEKKGIISIKNTVNIKEPGIILIRSHGITIAEELKIKNLGFEIIDATCPKVKHAHKICEDLAGKYSKIFIIGIKSHPEVKGILSRAAGKGEVFSSIKEVQKLKNFNSGGILAQTTFREEKFFEIVGKLIQKTKVLKIHNTICEETVNRQKELSKLAGDVEVLLVIGGKNSSNTKRLYEMGKELLQTYHIEIPDEIDTEWFKGKEKIGIVTGASTPLSLVEKLEEKIGSTIFC
jgi:4-hydroxy-3-methylbut-2-enyl diphosphate reductase